MLPAGLPELTHTGVDDWVAGAADLPRPQELLVRRPRKLLELSAERTIRGLGKMMNEMLGEFTPADLGHIFVATLGAEMSSGADGVDDFERRDLAEVQVRRKARSAVELGDISVGRILLHRGGHEVLQALLGSFTGRVPTRGKLAVPLDLREQAELGDVDGVQRPIERSQFLRGLEGDAELEVREAVLPERCEDLEGIPRQGLYEMRLVEEVAIERLGLEVGVAQRGLYLRVTLDDQRFVAAIPRHEPGTGFGDELLEHGERIAAADN